MDNVIPFAAYTLNGKQPVKCSHVSHQPLYTEDREALMAEMAFLIVTESFHHNVMLEARKRILELNALLNPTPAA